MNLSALFAARASNLANEASKIHDSLQRPVQLEVRDAIDHILQAKSHFQAASRLQDAVQKDGDL